MCPQQLCQLEMICHGETVCIELVLVGVKIRRINEQKRSIGSLLNRVAEVFTSEFNSLQLGGTSSQMSGPVVRLHTIFWPIAPIAVYRVHDDRKSTRLNSSHQLISYA